MNNDAPNKSLAQIAYETFLEELAHTQDSAEAEHAPPWEMVPEHVRTVIAAAVGAAVRSFAPALIVETTDDEELSFAQVGYQAYIASTGGLNYQGLPCPEWSKLTDAIRAAWAAAATAVRTEHEHRVAGEYDLSVSKEELTELVVALDAAQRANAHNPDVCYPLRARLRAILSPPEPAPEPAAPPAEVTDPAPPELTSTLAGERPSDLEPPKLRGETTPAEVAATPNPADLSEYGKAWHETNRQLNGLPPLETPDAAAESTSAKAERVAPATEPSPPADADTGLLGDRELPSPSKAPPGPAVPSLDLGIPGPPPMPTDTDPPAAGETELDEVHEDTDAGPTADDMRSRADAAKSQD